MPDSRVVSTFDKPNFLTLEEWMPGGFTRMAGCVWPSRQSLQRVQRLAVQDFTKVVPPTPHTGAEQALVIPRQQRRMGP